MKILRSSSNTFRQRRNKTGMKKSKSDMPEDGDEADAPSFEVDPLLKAEPHPEHFDGMDITMALEGNDLDHLAGEVSRMSLDPDLSRNDIEGERQNTTLAYTNRNI